jgi:hypothetical protein
MAARPVERGFDHGASAGGIDRVAGMAADIDAAVLREPPRERVGAETEFGSDAIRFRRPSDRQHPQLLQHAPGLFLLRCEAGTQHFRFITKRCHHADAPVAVIFLEPVRIDGMIFTAHAAVIRERGDGSLPSGGRGDKPVRLARQRDLHDRLDLGFQPVEFFELLLHGAGFLGQPHHLGLELGDRLLAVRERCFISVGGFRQFFMQRLNAMRILGTERQQYNRACNEQSENGSREQKRRYRQAQSAAGAGVFGDDEQRITSAEPSKRQSHDSPPTMAQTEVIIRHRRGESFFCRKIGLSRAILPDFPPEFRSSSSGFDQSRPLCRVLKCGIMGGENLVLRQGGTDAWKCAVTAIPI